MKRLVKLTAEQKRTAEANLPGAYFFARKVLKKHPHWDEQEVEACCLAALVRAAHDYDPDRGAFMTVLRWCVHSELHRQVRFERPKGFKQPDCRSPSAPRAAPKIVPLGDAADDLVDARGREALSLENRDELEHALARLPERARRLLEAHYLEGLTNSVIAGRLGLTRQAVDRAIRVALEQARAG